MAKKPVKKSLTKKQKNLLNLCLYCCGPLKAEFYMGRYAAYPTGSTCGTSGCFAGHGPYAGIKKTSDELWENYVNRCFLSCSYNSKHWTWLFDGAWESNATSAAKRGFYYLCFGVPENFWGWSDQIEDKIFQKLYKKYTVNQYKKMILEKFSDAAPIIAKWDKKHATKPTKKKEGAK